MKGHLEYITRHFTPDFLNNLKELFDAELISPELFFCGTNFCEFCSNPQKLILQKSFQN